MDIETPLPPARLCCGKRHYGNVCPDGLVMCCLCFDRFPIEKLNILPGGEHEDVCISCAKEEEQWETL